MGQGVPVMDLVQEGNIGTMEALKRFTPGKSKFSSYAQLWIKKYINDSVATVGRIVRLPMNHEFDIFKAKKAGKEVANLNTLSLDQKISDEGNATYGDMFNQCQPSIETKYQDEFINDLVNKYLNKINRDKDREIVKAYFGIGRDYPLTGQLLSDEFGMSKVGVSRIVNKTLSELRVAV